MSEDTCACLELFLWVLSYFQAIEEHTRRLEASVDEDGEAANAPRLLVFSQSTLDSLLSQMSEWSPMRVAVGIGLVVSPLSILFCFKSDVNELIEYQTTTS
jgi:hypothetical protein